MPWDGFFGFLFHLFSVKEDVVAVVVVVEVVAVVLKETMGKALDPAAPDCAVGTAAADIIVAVVETRLCWEWPHKV